MEGMDGLMKTWWIVLVSAVLLLLSVTPSIRANERPVKYPEPPRSAEVPDHWVWNEETGGYYDPEEFEWDPVNRIYRERFIIRDVYVPADEAQESEEEWIQKHENSGNPIDQALIHFYHEYSQRPRTPEAMFSSQFLTPAAKKALRHLVELGPEHVDDMLVRIESDSRWSMALCYAVLEITGLSSPELQYFDPVPEGRKQWVEKVRALTAGKA